MEKKALGKRGELQAGAYLEEKGWRILAKNVRNEYGEIDIIALDGNSLVFVEVKTAKTKKFGYPEVSVNKRKQKKMVECALAYLQKEPNMNTAWRIDVVAVYVLPDGQTEIKWFKNAISG